MFGNNYFGEYPFGGIPDFVPPDEERVILSANFIPEVLADEPLFSELTNLVDYIIHTYHVSEIKSIAGLYDTFHPDFNADEIIEFMGGSGHIVAPLNDSQKRSLVLLLSSLYEVKGLRSGIESLMSSFGIPGYIFEEWEVNGEVETGIPSRPDIFPFQIWYEKLESCNIAAVFNVTGKLAIDGLEDQLVQSVEALLWVCARLNRWIWLMDFRGLNVDTATMLDDTVEFYDYFTFCSKFFREGNVWCFLPKPIFECEETDPIDRKMVFFTTDEYGVPCMEEDEYGIPIFLNEEGVPVTEEEDGYDGSYFLDDYGNFTLDYWKYRPETDLDCCDDAQELVLYGEDSLSTLFYEDEYNSFLWDHSLIETESILVSTIEEECTFIIPTGFYNGTQIKILGVGVEENTELSTVFYMSIVPEEYLEYYEYGEYTDTMKIGLATSYEDALSYTILTKTELLSIIGIEYSSIILTWTELAPTDREDFA